MDYRQRGCRLEYSKDGVNWLLAFDYSACLSEWDRNRPKPSELTAEPGMIERTYQYYKERETLTIREWLDESESKDPSAIQICKAASLLINSLVAGRLANNAIPGDPPTEAEEWLAIVAGAIVGAGIGVLAAVFFPVSLGAGTLAAVGAMGLGVGGIVAERGLEQSLIDFGTSPDYVITDQDMEEAACCLYNELIASGASASTLLDVDFSCVTNAQARAFFEATVKPDVYPVLLAYMDDSENFPITCPCVECWGYLPKDPANTLLTGVFSGTRARTVETSDSGSARRQELLIECPAPLPLPYLGSIEITLQGEGAYFQASDSPATRIAITTQVRLDSGGMLGTTPSSVSVATEHTLAMPVNLSAWRGRTYTVSWSAPINRTVIGFVIRILISGTAGTTNINPDFRQGYALLKHLRFCPALPD